MKAKKFLEVELDPRSARPHSIDTFDDSRREVSDDDEIILVGDIFLSMAEALKVKFISYQYIAQPDKSVQTKMYTTYCANYPNAVNLLEILETNKEWQSFLAVYVVSSFSHISPLLTVSFSFKDLPKRLEMPLSILIKLPYKTSAAYMQIPSSHQRIAFYYQSTLR